MKQGCIWRVGNGRKINVYTDPWILQPSSRLALTAQRLEGIQHVSDLITSSRGWDRDQVMALLSKEEDDCVLQVPIGGLYHKDKLAWHYSPSGVYNVKSGYWVAWKLGQGTFVGSWSIVAGTKWWKNYGNYRLLQKLSSFSGKLAVVFFLQGRL